MRRQWARAKVRESQVERVWTNAFASVRATLSRNKPGLVGIAGTP